jgi:ubiquinone/menaquinone biosynthesis C-methylase UbiE
VNAGDDRLAGAGNHGVKPRLLRDAPDRSYVHKLALFNDFAEAELRSIIAELAIPAGGHILDLGCGDGSTTALLSECVGAEGFAVGLDLSLPHLLHARERYSIAFVQGDAEHLCFREGAFDLVWSCNTLNHLDDRDGALRSLRKHVRPGGRVVIAQSGFLPEMMFAWDSHLDDAVRQACHRYYRERYGLQPEATAAIRTTVGLLRAAGLQNISARTRVIERIQPLSQRDRLYFEAVIFNGTWRDRIYSLLDAESQSKLEACCDPDSADYCLDRADFHHIQTITVCEGRIGA